MTPPAVKILCVLLINIIIFVKSKNISCSNFPKSCMCGKYDSVDSYLNFYCPSIHDIRVEIRYRPNTTLSIDCITNAEKYPNLDFVSMNYPEPIDDLSLLPNLNVGFVNSLKLKYCPLPEGTINTIYKKLGLNKVRNVMIEGSNFDHITGKNNYFENISSDIESLELTQDEMRDLDDDIFSDMINLKVLDLNSNQLKEIRSPFKNLIKLKDLDLSRNYISRLNNNSFKGLGSLQILHLWNNSLTNLENNIFDDLTNLKSLELSRNPLKHISENIFKNLTNLERINLGFNNLIELPANLFSSNKKIKSIRIERCENLTHLPNKLFANLPLLENISITYSFLKNLPEDLFYNSTNIMTMNLNQNALTSLPEEIFANLTKLELLQLSGNSLTTLSKGFDKSFPRLIALDLSYNSISSELTNQVFGLALELRELKLQNNQIKKIQTQAFLQNLKLVEVNLSHNKLTLNEFESSQISLMNQCVDLEVLDLSFNDINSTSIFQQFWLTKQNLKALDLGNNKITSIDISELWAISNYQVEINLENNLINTVGLGNIEIIASFNKTSKDDPVTIIKISLNPILCDCNIYDLLRYFNSLVLPRVKTLIQLKADSLVCAGVSSTTEEPFNPTGKSMNLAGRRVVDLKPNMVTCRMEICPDTCDCAWRPNDNGYLIDCSNRNLTEMPTITEPNRSLSVNLVELNLENNSITDSPKEGMGYDNVQVLALSHNKITKISWIPPKIQVLKLDNNNLSHLPNEILQNLRNTTLHNNPWICDCTTVNLSIFLKDHFLPQKSNIVCRETKLKINLMSEKDLCPTLEKIILGVTLGLSILLLLTATLIALYYKYNEEINVWMYAHHICQWLFSEEKIDKNKLYDAFISYSHVDEQFVVKELVRKLESKPNPYKLCIHIRDWVPGEVIKEQITESIQNSRRTIIVLSPDFLKSVWGISEFKEAHMKAMTEGITRVIVILYGDVDIKDDTSDGIKSLKAYLKTNTYIKWGDPWFWKRLEYALPHYKAKENAVLNRKMDNISLHLDSMDYINCNSTPNIVSASTDHPFLAKQNGDIKSLPV